MDEEFLVRHYTLTIPLSDATRGLLTHEIDEILKHSDITDKQHDELVAIMEGLDEMDTLVLTH